MTQAVQKSITKEDLVIRGASWLQPFVLHPGSTKRLLWDVSGLLLLAYDVAVIPFVSAFNPPESDVMRFMVRASMSFWTADILMSMLTGYQDGKRTIMQPRMIWIHYLKTWCMMDGVIVSLDWLYILFMGQGSSTARLGRTLRFIRVVRTLRLLRILKLKRILEGIEDQINSETLSIFFSIVKIIQSLLLANHIVSCTWFAIGSSAEPGSPSWIQRYDMEDRALRYKYVTSLHWSLTQFTPASMEVVPQNFSERLFSVCVLIFAMVTFSSFVSMLTALMVALRKLHTDESRQFWLLRRYLRDWNVSYQMRTRIVRYLEYAYQRQKERVQERDVQLLSLLSDPLKEELAYHTFSSQLGGHPLFQACDERTRVFSKALVSTSAARDDNVFSCGQQATSMYFVGRGMLEYVVGEFEDADPSPRQAALELLVEGQWISEPVLWAPWIHLGDLVSLQMSQLIAVNAEKFSQAAVTVRPLWSAGLLLR